MTGVRRHHADPIRTGPSPEHVEAVLLDCVAALDELAEMGIQPSALSTARDAAVAVLRNARRTGALLRHDADQERRRTQNRRNHQ